MVKDPLLIYKSSIIVDLESDSQVHDFNDIYRLKTGHSPTDPITE